MDVTVEAPVARQIQSTDFYCGAACAAMLLGFLGREIAQSAAYDQIRAANLEPDNFYTDPQGLSRCLQSDLTAVDGASTFGNIAPPDAQTVLTALLSDLTVARSPVPVLVKGGAHWVLVDGLIVDQADGSSTIKMVLVVDPWPKAAARTLIPADVFCQQYLSPVRFGEHWLNTRVLLHRSTPSPDLRAAITRQPEIGGGAKIEDGTIAGHLAALGVGRVRALLAGGAALDPIDVTDLDGGPPYTIRALDATDNASLADTIAVAFDADTGRILEVAKAGSQFDFFGDDEALGLARARWPGEVTLDPGFFFFASRRLRSRFLVARRLHVDGAEMWLMPGGEISPTRDPPLRGGE